MGIYQYHNEPLNVYIDMALRLLKWFKAYKIKVALDHTTYLLILWYP